MTTTPTLPRGDELAAVSARMAGLLLTQETVGTALRLVVSLAQETAPGTAGAGVTLVSDGRPATGAASAPVVEEADRLQYALDEGPCLQAWRERVAVRVDHVQEDARWPRWSSAVASLGVRSSFSAPLVAGDEALGAVKLYAARPGRFDAGDERVLTLFAAKAAVLVANVRSYESATRLSDQLREALRSRDVIGTAKGVLMAREGVDEETAFAMLVSVSQRSNRRLREVAEELVRRAARRRR